ncbi:intermembrane phospholipid transport protein YdbH family protein [Qipengyuania sediminis]|uniref:intermembrane phospholipid transport protein YdbH family protein n=1 Tax=Qipengyuania sediminis TaxID=1532023 RepID=UPI001059CD3D|nr:YdbH domain-containing protein [Qipengyuania sediminis]
MDAGEPRRSTWGWRRKRVLFPAAMLAALALGLAAAWLLRERIADNLIARQLARYDIPARYEIERIGGRRQVLSNLVVGDPGRPDLTAERVEVRIVYRLGTPRIGRITLVAPRLYGRWAGGRVSFGTLDRVLYTKSGRPPGLPEIDIAVRDGRALIRTPAGPLGVKLEGEGVLADGFAGRVAMAAPALSALGCEGAGSSLYGRIETDKGAPRFSGPVRLSSLACPAQRIAAQGVAAEFEASGDAGLAAWRFRASLTGGPLRGGSYRAAGVQAALRGTWEGGVLAARHTVALSGVEGPQAAAALLTIAGTARASDGFANLALRSRVEGNGLRPGQGITAALATLGTAGADTLLAPLASRVAAAIDRQARGSAISADLALRRAGGRTGVTIPQAELRGRGGARLVSISRLALTPGATGAASIAGSIATGGPGLPRITGRMERDERGRAVVRLVMAPYAAGGSSLALPQLTLNRGTDGALAFSGRALASGPLPGGSARGLTLPVDGWVGRNGALELWRRCAEVGFEQLQFASLALEGRRLTVCPAPGRAILERRGSQLRIAAGTGALDLAGRLGRTPIRIRSGPVGLAWPGVMTARAVAIALGPQATASRFAISNLEARLGGGAIGGRFAGADVRLDAVPLDLRQAAGKWRYARGALTLAGGAFRLTDRREDPRFEPLMARDASLRLADNIVTADAALRHPGTDRVVTRVDLRHDLAAGRGFADLAVPGLLFDPRLQPVGLTRRALGVVANTRGLVTGTGRIDWGPGGTTSTGAFSSEALDFAAAFGPVRGARGTVVFSDLIGLTTAPGQRISAGAVNPGIEVTDGEFGFQLRGGRLLAVEGGSWPFMGGRLILKAVDVNFGVAESRRFVFEVEGLDAAAFVTRFQLPNIAASGLFDGTVPIVFEPGGGGRIEGGSLLSRPPGGNVSYVGELTYKNLSPVANFAFDTLRSLDYSRMTIAMNGSLTGEIVTNVNFDGVRQGAGAKRNFVTRALGNLPIQFRVNIRAPFYQLITSFKSMRDPAAVRDPRELGLLSDDGIRFLKPEVRGEDVPEKVTPGDVIDSGRPVQN